MDSALQTEQQTHPETVVKRGRGRPKKVVVEVVEKVVKKAVKKVVEETTQSGDVKNKGGRPAKYSLEDKKDKYKDTKLKWLNDNKELSRSNSMAYQERARYALKLLNTLWKEKLLEYISNEKYKFAIKNLIENKSTDYSIDDIHI